MGQLVRLNDTSDHGGKMVSSSGNYTVDGLPGCVSGDMHQCPITGHGTTPVTSTSSATANGKALIRTGDRAACGAIINSGSSSSTAA